MHVLLVLVGAWMDILINYAAHSAGLQVSLPFIVAVVVAVWLTLNEIISILENIIDIGVPLPPFLLPIVKHIKQAVEDKAAVNDEENSEEEKMDISRDESQIRRKGVGEDEKKNGLSDK